MLFALCLSSTTARAETEDWGLGFQTPGQKPTGNASPQALLAHNAYFVGDGEEKVLYLTFDAGYENGFTDAILDVLKEAQVPAAFFLVGTYIRDYPELVRRMAAEGHIVGNHTMHHPDMSAISEQDAFAAELAETESYYRQATGAQMPAYYRPPQGKYSEANLEMAASLGYATVFWSLAYVDWKVDHQPTREEAFEKLLPRVHPGAVLLLHSTSQTNAEILKDLIAAYREQGYEFKSLDALTGKGETEGTGNWRSPIAGSFRFRSNTGFYSRIASGRD